MERKVGDLAAQDVANRTERSLQSIVQFGRCGLVQLKARL